MDTIYAKLNDWIELVQSHQLKGIASDIKNTITVDLDDVRLNKMVFKLLLHLSRTADQCDKSENETIKEIGKLTKTICSLLVRIPNEHKFFSSIYHITRCLITAKLYSDAMEICDWLMPGRLLKATPDSSDIYITMSSLWQKAVEHQLHKACDSLNDQTWESLITLIIYECHMMQIAYGQQWKRVLNKIDFYFEKIIEVIKVSERSYYEHFCDSMISYMMSLRISFEGNYKVENYRYVLLLINRIILEQITSSKIEYAGITFKKLCKAFENSMKKDKECRECFEFYKEICTIYLRPVMSLNNCKPDSIQQVLQQYKNIVPGLSIDGAVKWNSYMLARILTLLFTYWEQSLKDQSWKNINTEVLRETMVFLQFICSILTLQIKDTCKACNVVECKLKQDFYNAVVLKLRFLSVLSTVSEKNLLKDIYPIVQTLLEESISSIFEMKLSECKQWIQMWSICGSHIYNLGITYKEYYEESTFLFSLLCSCIVQFEGFNSSVTYIHLDNTWSTALHRLCSIHYNHGKYREALTAAALNGLISYNDSTSKAFRMWANIKYKCVTSESIMKMTILECLETDRQIVSEIGVDFDLNDYDLHKLCLREIKALQESHVNLSVAIIAVLDQLESLNPNALEYGHGVLLLGFHSLIYEIPDQFYEYLKKAVSILKKEKYTWAHISLSAGFEFYKFINHATTMSKQTQLEMDSAKFALLAPKLHAAQQEPENVVPAYSTINIKEDSRLHNYLRQPLKTWALYIEKIDILKSFVPWESEQILQTIVIAGEYCRLHRFLDCEIDAWKLAYNLATKQKSHRVIIYVVGRAISSRYINKEWIDTATKLSMDLKYSTDNDVIEAIAAYWIGLADFYFEIGKYDDGLHLFDEATILQESSVLYNQSTYLMRLDMLLRNDKLNSRSNEKCDFSLYIVQSLYAMISLSTQLLETKRESKEKILYGYDVLLSSTNHMSLRFNSLLSFKEISAHLVHRLKMSQKLGATLRVAECLKNLCFIDLSRMQLDDCEVKLQGLEHILDIESIQLSMKSKLQTVKASSSSLSSSERMVESVRDIAQNPASPVLRTKVFAPSDFLLHKDCTCYKCKNLPYQHLVFASTYIRAQLYALQNERSAAMEHFYGALKVRRNIFEKESIGSLDCTIKKMDLERHPWEFYYNMVEYVLFLLDFSRFIKRYKLATEEKGLTIALEAINICETHNLENHPIYISSKELLFEYRYQKILSTVDYSKFTVPTAGSIDVSKFTQETNPELSTCVTPTHNVQKNQIKALRRHRTPPPLKLTKVSINLSDDEETTPLHESKSRRNLNSVKSRLPLNDCPESSDEENSFFTPVNPVLEKPKSIYSERLSLEDMIDKASSVLPEMSSRLRKLSIGQPLKEPPHATKIQELIKLLEESTIKDATRPARKSRSRVKSENRISSKQNPLSEKNNEGVIEIINLFKGLLLSSKSAEDTLESNIHKTSLELESSSGLSVESDIKLTPRASGNKILKTYNKRSVRTKLFVSNAKDTPEIASNSLKNNENRNSERIIANSNHCTVNCIGDKDSLNVPVITVDEFEKVSDKKSNAEEIAQVKGSTRIKESRTSKVLLYSNKKTENVPNVSRPKSKIEGKKLPKRSVASTKKVIVYSDSEDENSNCSDNIAIIDPKAITSVRTTRSTNRSTRQSKKNFPNTEPATSVPQKELVNADGKKSPKRTVGIKDPEPSTSKKNQTKSKKRIAR